MGYFGNNFMFLGTVYTVYQRAYFVKKKNQIIFSTTDKSQELFIK